MNKMIVMVDGEEQERNIDYSARRGRDTFVDYPVLNKFEHIYENESGIRVFSSIVE